MTRFNMRGKATHPEWAKMTDGEKTLYYADVVAPDRDYWITHADGVRVAFYTPKLRQQALMLTDAEKEAFFNANAIVVDDPAKPTIEIR